MGGHPDRNDIRYGLEFATFALDVLWYGRAFRAPILRRAGPTVSFHSASTARALTRLKAPSFFLSRSRSPAREQANPFGRCAALLLFPADLRLLHFHNHRLCAGVTT